MYACKNCGADMHFDIKLQKLKCDACEQSTSVYEMVKEQDGIADEYEVNVFECPQCGGQLLSDDTSITQFCSFCGGMSVLAGRIANEKMPKEIIPFQITKEDCHEAYKKHMKKMFYAPKAFRDCQGEQDFRAIYVPYWKFHETQSGLTRFEAEKKQGEDRTVIRYEATLDADYDNIIYDASSSFADELGDLIAPFDALGLKEFTPSYLCGFYADTADVPFDIYMDDAKEAAQDKTVKYIQDNITKQNAGYEIPKENKKKIETESDQGSRILLPAWFLAYRKGNRVAYATVNGQTGKVEADLPIDLKKFGVVTVAVALIFFVVLNMLFTLKPSLTMAITSVLLTVIMKLYADEMKKVFYKDHKLSDQGFAYKFQNLYWNAKADEDKIKKNEEKKDTFFTNVMEFLLAIFVIAFTINIPLGIVVVAGLGYYLYSNANVFYLWIIATIVTLIYLYQGYLYIEKTESLKGVGAIFAAIAVVISGCITIINPVSDLYYYFGTFATLLAVLVSALDLIHSYNVAATQPLPEFNRKRGAE